MEKIKRTNNFYSPREKELYNYLCKYIKKNGYPPLMREMINHLGLKAVSRVHKMLENLEKKQYVERASMGSRGTTPIPGSEKYIYLFPF